MLGDRTPGCATTSRIPCCPRISDGVYDELLAGLGDGLALGLRVGLGEDGTDTVLRRSFSALCLAAVVARDNTVHTLHPTTVLTWADRSVAWFLAERDLRGWVPERGWPTPSETVLTCWRP